MTPDSELLHRYAETDDEAAFAEVVRRHVNLVYAASLRLLNGDAMLAEDVTQMVFTDLATKAGKLSSHASVIGWLHTSARYTASSAIRSEQRRRAREQKALAMSEPDSQLDLQWTQLRPHLDDAIGRLRDGERDAVLLRYFEEKSHREVGQALGLSENAARMKVERGLDKMRLHFERNGVKATTALIATSLASHAATMSAPHTFAVNLAGNSLQRVAEMKAAGCIGAHSGVTKTFFAKAFAVFAGTTVVTTGGLLLLAPPPHLHNTTMPVPTMPAQALAISAHSNFTTDTPRASLGIPVSPNALKVSPTSLDAPKPDPSAAQQ